MISDIDTQASGGSLHCCACDVSFHPPWYEDSETFEELCPTCLVIAIGYRLEDEVETLLQDLAAGLTLTTDNEG